MATTRRTSGWKGQGLDAHYVPALQDKLLTPDKEEDGHTRGHLFVFLFLLFPISHFYHKCNPSLPLGNYKREGMNTHTWLGQHTHLPRRDLGSALSLKKKLVTPTTSTPVQGNTSSSNTHWT
jgi:hypothetical protein